MTLFARIRLIIDSIDWSNAANLGNERPSTYMSSIGYTNSDLVYL